MRRRRKSLARAAVNPVGLGVAAGAGVAAAIGLFPLAAIGGFIYAAVVAYDALAPDRRAPATPELPDAVTLPDPSDVADTQTRDAVTQLVAAKQEIEKVLEETPPDVLATLTKTIASLHELEAYAARLVARAEVVAKHLAGVDLPDLVSEVKQLNVRITHTGDQTAKQTFEQAKATRMDELRTLKELKTVKDRIDANLMRIVAVLSALPTKVVHMRALDAQAMDRISGDVNDELAAVGHELKTSESIIKQLA